MQKFIRIGGLLLFILFVSACVKEDIPSFSQKIHQSWQLEIERTFLFDEDNELDTILVKEYESDTLTLYEFGTDDTISFTEGKPYLMGWTDDDIHFFDSVYFDIVSFERVYWETKGDNEIRVAEDDVYEIYYLEFGELIMKQYIHDFDDEEHPFKRKEYSFIPYVAPPNSELDSLGVFIPSL